MFAAIVPDKTLSKKHQFTQEVDGPEVPGEGKARRMVGIKELAGLPDEVLTLHGNLQRACDRAGNKPYLGYRPVVDGKVQPFVWSTYNEILERVNNLAAGFASIGHVADDNIGLFSINRIEWVVAEQACFHQALITVPLYDTLGPDAIQYIVQSAETATIVATADKAEILVKNASILKHLKNIVVMNDASEELVSSAKAAGFNIYTMAQLEKTGKESPKERRVINADSIATICYTSGTTGLPKGVLLSHRNILSFVGGYMELAKKGEGYHFSSEDLVLSYLPLAHIFERVIQATMVYHCARIGFYQGDTLKLLDDVCELKPTVFASVPRLYNRIFDKIQAGVKAKGGVAAKLFYTALSAKKAYLKKGYVAHPLYDAIVFSKVKARLGGRVRLLVSGAAPLSGEVIDFMRVCFGAHFQEGYGQSETAAVGSIQILSDLTSGHIGVPAPSCEIKLLDVPSMNYTSKDEPHPRGEILIRGACVFQGYYKAPEKTAETMHGDWIRTGDVGMWDSQGRLRIIDRVKNIFKLAQGEYIAPEKVEVVYNKHELVAQSFVYGDSLQAFLVGVIVPDWEVAKGWAEKNGFPSGSLEEFCKHAGAKDAIIKELVAHGKANDLKGFENVKNIHLAHEAFTPENGLLSPTFKLKRHEAKGAYLKQIEGLYKASA